MKQPTVFRFDPSKTRRSDLALFAILFCFGLMSLARIVFARPDWEIVLWLQYATVIACGLAAIILLARSNGLNIFDARSRLRLELDDEGLTYVRVGLLKPLRFSWAELSKIEFQGPGFLRKSSVVFRPDVTGLKRWLTLGLSIFEQSMRLDDIFDAAPEEIAAKLNEYRDRALADGGPSADTASSGERPICFENQSREIRGIGVVGWAVSNSWIVWLPAVLFLGWPFDFIEMDGWAESPSQWSQRFLIMLVPILIIAELLILMREIRPADNALTLDRTGLTLTRGGRRKHWAWPDLSAFEVEARKIVGLFGPRGVILFCAPGGRDLRSRFLRLCYRLTRRAPAFVIEDVYDTPLEAIATKLNGYRDRALTNS